MRSKFFAATTAVLLASTGAWAGSPSAAPEKTVAEPTRTEVPLNILRLRSSYVFESDFDNDRGSGDALANSIEISRRFALDLPWPKAADGQWFFRLGAEYARFDFNHTGDLPLPNTLQSFAAVIALEYLQRGEVGILLESAPGFYFEESVSSEAFAAPTLLAAAFPVSEKLFLIGGASYHPFRSYPILPVAGVLWKISDRWTLRAIVPEPRLIFRAGDQLALWAGAELSGGSFRVDESGDRDPKLRGAVLTYSEYRVGAGFTYGDPNRTAIDFGAGYAFNRKFDYHRADEDYETEEGAPYVKLTFRAGF
ncbi:MAG TPA: hypothetical protein VF593_11080 [Chthoniobacteraceae bacterium]|jgi:hypothetical protein